MNQAPEQLIALNKANMETAIRFAGIALEGTERMFELQLRAAKSALADGAEHIRALSQVKDAKQLSLVRPELAQPSIEKATSYVKSMCDVAVETTTQMNKLVEEQVAEFSKNVAAGVEQMVKNAPAGSQAAVAAMQDTFNQANTAYGNMSKAAKQMASSAQATVESDTLEVVQNSKKR